jgi:hypothetical protein
MPEQGQTRAQRTSGEMRQRRAFVPVRYSDDEKAEIHRRAERAGISASDYVRMQVLGMPMPRAQRRPSTEQKELARILGQLGKLGSNINQIAAATNSGNAPPPSYIARALAELAEMRDAVIAALGRG